MYEDSLHSRLLPLNPAFQMAASSEASPEGAAFFSLIPHTDTRRRGPAKATLSSKTVQISLKIKEVGASMLAVRAF
jgi:hypothetical protein